MMHGRTYRIMATKDDRSQKVLPPWRAQEREPMHMGVWGLTSKNLLAMAEVANRAPPSMMQRKLDEH